MGVFLFKFPLLNVYEKCFYIVRYSKIYIKQNVTFFHGLCALHRQVRYGFKCMFSFSKVHPVIFAKVPRSNSL